MRLTLPACTALAVALLCSPAGAETTWTNIKSASGTVKSTTVNTGGGNTNRNNNNRNNSNYRVKPVYIDFKVTGPGMRIRYETQAAAERPDLKMELQQEVERPNGKKDWRRVGIVGRERGDGKGEVAFATGPGNYRIEMTGENMRYKIDVEQPELN